MANDFTDLEDYFNAESQPAPSLLPREAAILQQEELDVLFSILSEPGELSVSNAGGLRVVRATLRSGAVEATLHHGGGLVDALAGSESASAAQASHASLVLVLPALYPSVPPLFEIEQNHGDIGREQSGEHPVRSPLLVSARAEEALFAVLESTADRAATVCQPVIYELVVRARDWLVDALCEAAAAHAALAASLGWSTGTTSSLAGLLAAEHDAEEPLSQPVSEMHEAYRGAHPHDEPGALRARMRQEAYLDYLDGHRHRSPALGTIQLPLERCYHHPAHYVGSVCDLLEGLPSHLRVTAVENVMRRDLASRFEDCRQQLAQDKKIALGGGATPRRAYHGTAVGNVASIVTTGLCVPGSRGVRIVNGAAFGRGIYLSTDPELSLGYCRGRGKGDTGRLLVCAALLGTHSTSGIPTTRRKCTAVQHSYFRKPVMVLSRAQQCLPCYVVHFSYAADAQTLKVTRGGTVLAQCQTSSVIGATDTRLDVPAIRQTSDTSIKNAAFYFDTRKFKVLGCADHEDDDDDFDFVQGYCHALHETGLDSDVVGAGAGEYQAARIAKATEYIMCCGE